MTWWLYEWFLLLSTLLSLIISQLKTRTNIRVILVDIRDDIDIHNIDNLTSVGVVTALFMGYLLVRVVLVPDDVSQI